MFLGCLGKAGKERFEVWPLASKYVYVRVYVYSCVPRYVCGGQRKLGGGWIVSLYHVGTVRLYGSMVSVFDLELCLLFSECLTV